MKTTNKAKAKMSSLRMKIESSKWNCVSWTEDGGKFTHPYHPNYHLYLIPTYGDGSPGDITYSYEYVKGGKEYLISPDQLGKAHQYSVDELTRTSRTLNSISIMN